MLIGKDHCSILAGKPAPSEYSNDTNSLSHVASTGKSKFLYNCVSVKEISLTEVRPPENCCCQSMSQAPQEKEGAGNHEQIYHLKFLSNCKRNSQLAAFKILLYLEWWDTIPDLDKGGSGKSIYGKKREKENSCPEWFHILQPLGLERAYHGSIHPESQTWKGAHSIPKALLPWIRADPVHCELCSCFPTSQHTACKQQRICTTPRHSEGIPCYENQCTDRILRPIIP